jgi:hypothetical protein
MIFEDNSIVVLKGIHKVWEYALQLIYQFSFLLNGDLWIEQGQ